MESASLQPKLIPSTRSSVAYLIKDQSIQFKVPSFANSKLRIITNLVFEPSYKDYETRLNYAIQIQGFKANGESIFIRTLNHISGLPKQQLNKDNELLDAKFIRDDTSQYITATGQAVYLENNELQADSIVVRLHKKAPQSVGLIVRARSLEKLDRAASQSRWHHLNQDSKDRVVQPHIYDVSLIPFEEKLESVDHRWHRLGIMGKDTQGIKTVQFYEVDDAWYDDYRKEDELLSVEHILLDKDLKASLVIQNKAPFQLKFATTQITPLTWHWYGYSGAEMTGESKLDSPFIDFNLAPGLLVLTSQTPLQINSESNENTLSDIQHMRLYPLTYGDLHFNNVDQGDGSHNLMRLDLRFLASEKNMSNLLIEGFDINGKIIISEKIKPQWEIDQFQRVIDKTTQRLRVTKVQSKVYNLPRAVQTIKVSGNSSALVSMYTKNQNMPLIVRLPQEKHLWMRDEYSVNAWLYHKPEEHYQLSSDGYLSTLRLFKSPADIYLESFNYSSIMLEGKAAYEGFVELDQFALQERPYSHNTYYQLPDISSGNTLLEPSTESLNNSRSLRLYYTQNSTQLNQVKINLNGRLIDYTLVGQSGRIDLPIKEKVPVRLNIKGQYPLTWYANEWRHDINARAFIRRYFFELKDDLSLELSNYELSQLSVTVLSSDQQKNVSYQVQVQHPLNQAPVDKLTHRNRLVYLQPDSTRSGFLIGKDESGYTLQSTAAIPFHSDIQSEKLSLKIHNRTSSSYWIAFSQLQPVTMNSINWSRHEN